MIHLVLLSGGSGTRLWPLSNDSRSKQFLKVLRDENNTPISMVQRVYSQVCKIDAEIEIVIATCSAQKAIIESQIHGDYSIVIESERRDTAPAIMLACSFLYQESDANENDTVIVMPIDTFAEQSYYDSVVKIDEAIQRGNIDLALLGVEPTYPSTKYGYIVPEVMLENALGLLKVHSFVEKPSTDIAKKLIASGALWNCGVFGFKLGYLLRIAQKYVPGFSYDEFKKRYSQLPKNSFDYEVVEHADNIGVITYAGYWKDLGTWNTLTEEMAESVSGRAIIDDKTCDNIHVVNETGLPLVVAGLTDSVVVATPDGILVSGKEASANIKEQISLAAETRPMYEQRRWGEYRVIDANDFPDGNVSLTKELVVKKGQQLSYQIHKNRYEVWTIVAGTGEVVLDGHVSSISFGSVVQIKPNMMHSVRAFDELHIIEVQLGDRKLIEEDIERFGNFWS